MFFWIKNKKQGVKVCEAGFFGYEKAVWFLRFKCDFLFEPYRRIYFAVNVKISKLLSEMKFVDTDVFLINSCSANGFRFTFKIGE